MLTPHSDGRASDAATAAVSTAADFTALFFALLLGVDATVRSSPWQSPPSRERILDASGGAEAGSEGVRMGVAAAVAGAPGRGGRADADAAKARKVLEGLVQDKGMDTAEMAEAMTSGTRTLTGWGFGTGDKIKQLNHINARYLHFCMSKFCRLHYCSPERLAGKGPCVPEVIHATCAGGSARIMRDRVSRKWNTHCWSRSERV